MTRVVIQSVTSDVLPHPMFTSDVRTCRNVYKRLCATEHVCSGTSRIFVREGGGGKTKNVPP